MPETQQKRGLEAEYDRLLSRMNRAVAEGRMTRDEAETATELEWLSRLNTAPSRGYYWINTRAPEVPLALVR
ncbi:hypothetical protein AHiyo4_34710 [Arthrobacter sp. Hiyo4]|nr:hypothetical protein AHiyo4_34710 [Arthrobacter sp. Hiyo4]